MTESFTWAGEPLGVKDARDRLDNFAADYGRAPTLLALHVAVLERFRADIVALVRREFLPKAISSDISADADVLFGPLSWSLGGGYFRMDSEVRRQCLIALDAWGARQGDQTYRSRQVAQFVRRYVNWLRRHPPAEVDPVFADYLNTIEWVALGFDDPDAAARSMALHMKSQLGSRSGASMIRLTGLASVLELPMAAFMDELNYARAIDALGADDYERAVTLVSAHRHSEFRMGDEVLPPPQEMLDRYEAERYLRQAVAKMAEDAAGGTSGPPRPDVSNLSGLSLNAEPVIETGQPAEDSPLHVAIKAGELISVEALLATSPELIDAPGDEGKTALHLAAERGRADLVELLLRARANPNLGDVRMATPLHLAAENGRRSVAELLVECADLEARNLKGSTPLAFAVVNGHADIARMLIEKGAAADVPNYLGLAPVAYAAFEGRLSMVELLLSYGVDLWRVSRANVDLMLMAACGGRLALVEKLVDAGLPIDRRDENGWTPLLAAAFYGRTAVAEFLVEIGAYVNDVQKEGWTALHAAGQEGHAEVIRRLIRLGAVVDSTLEGGYTPLHIAALHGRAGAAAELLAHGADVRRKAIGMTPLLWACAKGFGEVVRLLLSHPDTDPHATDGRGASALQLAVEAKSEDAVRALLEDPRTDCNVTGGPYDTPPLWQAADRQSWEVFGLLCDDPRTDKDWTDSSGDTQLHRSASKNEVVAVDRLIASGARIDPVNRASETPLLKALGALSEGVVKSLLAHGADPEQHAGWPKQTPLAAAVTTGFGAGVRMLAQAGARLERATPVSTSLMHQAASQKKTEVVDALVSLGLGVDARDSREAAPLHLAAAHSDGAMVNHLLRLAARADSRDREGLTPLHYALRMANLETAEELIKGGADVTASTLDGWTALHFAAQCHLEEFVGRLIEGGGHVEEVSLNPPMTPLQVAAESGATGVVKRLLAAGADPEASNSLVGPPLVLAVRNGHYTTGLLLIEAGAGLRGVDPVSGVGLIELFEARRLRRQSVGQEADTDESELARILSTAAPARLTPQARTAEPASLTAEPAGSESLEAWAGPQSNVIRFAPLRGLDFEDPEEPVLEPWHAVRGRERLRLLAIVRHLDAKIVLGTDSTQVLWTTLPFYERVYLLRLRDRNWAHPRRALFYLKVDNNFVRLDGTSPPIHQVNTDTPIQLNDHNVVEYVRFFGFFVRGEGGPFYVLESSDDPALAPMPEDVRETVFGGMVRPAEVVDTSEQGHFMLKAVLAYSNALYLVDIVVQMTGMVEMLNDQPIAGDLPAAIIDAPIS